MSFHTGIAEIGTLMGAPARANIIAALMGGSALTATELAQAAGVSSQTASSHLAKLTPARLLAVEKQGRHHYYRDH
jgi:DNA-binding transcriptional ArsR family regulator